MHCFHRRRPYCLKSHHNKTSPPGQNHLHIRRCCSTPHHQRLQHHQGRCINKNYFLPLRAALQARQLGLQTRRPQAAGTSLLHHKGLIRGYQGRKTYITDLQHQRTHWQWASPRGHDEQIHRLPAQPLVRIHCRGAYMTPTGQRIHRPPAQCRGCLNCEYVMKMISFQIVRSIKRTLQDIFELIVVGHVHLIAE